MSEGSEFYVIKERDSEGSPVKVEVLAPEDVTIARSNDGKILGYIYTRRDHTRQRVLQWLHLDKP